MKTRIKQQFLPLKMAYGGVLVAAGVLLPQMFHIFGQQAGMIFLPIQIPVLLAGFLLGPVYGGIVGVLVPILSCILTAMPPVPKVYFMVFELVSYGIVTGVLRNKCNIFVSLAFAMIAGRAAYGLSLVLGVTVFGFHAPFASMTAFTAGIVTGIPGILIQFIVIPPFYFLLKRSNLVWEDYENKKNNSDPSKEV